MIRQAIYTHIKPHGHGGNVYAVVLQLDSGIPSNPNTFCKAVAIGSERNASLMAALSKPISPKYKWLMIGLITCNKNSFITTSI